jgi:HAD superfamily hydrolase (TIGR01509 family)
MVERFMADGFLPAAVIFDMDGLLLDSERVYERVWSDSMAAVGVALSHENFITLIGRGRAGALVQIKRLYGDAVDTERLAVELQNREGDYFSVAPVPLRPGVLELLSVLDTLRLPRCIATSTRRAMAEERLGSAAIRDRFSFLVCGDEVKQSKPAPDIFLKAAAELGAEPGTIMVLEDSENGIRAAAAAGMIPVMVPDLIQPSDSIRALCAKVATSLHEVASLLETRAP